MTWTKDEFEKLYARFTESGLSIRDLAEAISLPRTCRGTAETCLCTHNFLMDQANGGIVRTISRTQAVWKNFQDYKYILSDKFIDTLTFMAENKAVAQSAKRAHKFNSDVDASVEVFKLGAQYWIYVIDRTRYVFFEYLYQKS